jgi:RimJ/RimL family protein N-acetyltransferase
MTSHLETPRFRLRSFTLDDFQNLLLLDSDPEVMKYLSNGIPSTPEHIDKVLKRVIERDAQLKTMGT